MTIHYLDASAWVKRYIGEEGSRRINAWMNQDPLVASSALEAIEVLATVVRKARAGEVLERDRDRIVEKVRAEFELFAHIYHTAEVVKYAQETALRYGLRWADTVHLASALWLRDHLPSEIDALTMITSDRELAEAAEHAGLDVFDPTREPLPSP